MELENHVKTLRRRLTHVSHRLTVEEYKVAARIDACGALLYLPKGDRW